MQEMEQGSKPQDRWLDRVHLYAILFIWLIVYYIERLMDRLLPLEPPYDFASGIDNRGWTLQWIYFCIPLLLLLGSFTRFIIAKRVLQVLMPLFGIAALAIIIWPALVADWFYLETLQIPSFLLLTIVVCIACVLNSYLIQRDIANLKGKKGNNMNDKPCPESSETIVASDQS